MRNAYVDFSQMTCSVMAVAAEHKGRRFTGFGYTSNGRYAQSGLLRERFIRLLLEAGPLLPATLARVREIVMRTRSQAVMANGASRWAAWRWPSGTSRRRSPASPGIGSSQRPTACRHPPDRVTVYAAGGYYSPTPRRRQLRAEIRRFVDLGYPLVKMKIGGAPLGGRLERIAKPWTRRGRRRRGCRREWTAGRRGGDRVRARAGRGRRALVRGARRSAGLPGPGGRRSAAAWFRSRPARTCSRCRTRGTCCGSADWTPARRSSRWILC